MVRIVQCLMGQTAQTFPYAPSPSVYKPQKHLFNRTWIAPVEFVFDSLTVCYKNKATSHHYVVVFISGYIVRTIISSGFA